MKHRLIFLFTGILSALNCAAFFGSYDDVGLSLKCIEKEGRLKLNFINVGTSKSSLFAPCLTNTLIQVKDESSNEVQPKVLLRQNCDTHLFDLPENDTATFFYPYTLAEMYDLKNGKTYKIKVEYYIYCKGKVTRKIVADCEVSW